MNLGLAVVRVGAVEGRYLEATGDTEAGQTVHVGEAYALALHEEWSERVCASCFAVREQRLSHVCGYCERTFYCSSECRKKHRTMGAAGSVPHHLVCPGLAALGPIEENNTLVQARLLLEVLARRHGMRPDTQAKRAADELAGLQHQRRPTSCANASELRWCDGVRVAVAACGWGADVAVKDVSDEALLELVSRFEINGFDCIFSAAPDQSAGTAIHLGVALHAACGSMRMRHVHCRYPLHPHPTW